MRTECGRLANNSDEEFDHCVDDNIDGGINCEGKGGGDKLNPRGGGGDVRGCTNTIRVVRW